VVPCNTFAGRAEDDLQPYVIKQGDYLAALAYQLGFDADTVWNDPANADLVKLRQNPNILFPSDILYIPEQVDKDPAAQSLKSGTTNTFVTNRPTVKITVQFADAAFASLPFTVQELPNLTGLRTGADGTATFSVPVSLAMATVVFSSRTATFACQIGNVDPLGTLSGTFQRLQNLGYIAQTIEFEQVTVDELNVLLRFFVAAQPSGACLFSSAQPPAESDIELPVDVTRDGDNAGDTDASSPSSIVGYGGVSRAWLEGVDLVVDDGTLSAGIGALLQTAHGC
jgi:LysM repeat protein